MATRSTSRASGSASAPAQPTDAMRVVIVHGPESFLLEAHTRALQQALEKVHGPIEVTHHDGGSAAIADVLDDLLTLCFLSPHKLVIVDDADRFLLARDDDGEPPARGRRAKTPRDLLERYADDPLPASTLLLRASTWRPGKLDRKAHVFKCEVPDDRIAAQWCVRRTKEHWNCTIEPAAAALLVERLGPGLVRLDSELGKLASFAGGAGGSAGAAGSSGKPGTIDRAAVAEMVGVSREEKVWALQDPMLAGNAAATIRQLRELMDVSGQPDVLIAWSMTDLLRKLATAAQLLRSGTPPAAVRSELKLFGPAASRIIEIASRAEPRRLIALLHEALETDRAGKSGLGRSDRNLEVLALRIVDTMRG